MGMAISDIQVQIRTATLKDAKELLEIYAPYVTNTAITFEYTVPTADEIAERIETVLQRYPYLVAEHDGKMLGYAYANRFHARPAYDWAVETSIYVRMDSRRMGVGEKLYTELEASLKEQGILNLNACIACPETADEYLTTDSVLFHEKLGYRLAGRFRKCGYKFHRWYDVVWMEKHIGEHRADQPPVKFMRNK